LLKISAVPPPGHAVRLCRSNYMKTMEKRTDN
jgi:hypothetical protein